MKLESLKDSKFEAMTTEAMSSIKGGGYIRPTNSNIGLNTDRQEVITNPGGGYTLGCTEFFYNGAWH